MAIDLTPDTFEEFVSGNTVLIDFWAPWCGPCKAVSPELDKVSKSRDVLVGKINIDDYPGLAQKYGVQSIPAIYSFAEGTIVKQMVGAAPASTIEQNLLP